MPVIQYTLVDVVHKYIYFGEYVVPWVLHVLTDMINLATERNDQTMSDAFVWILLQSMEGRLSISEMKTIFLQKISAFDQQYTVMFETAFRLACFPQEVAQELVGELVG